MIVTTWMVRNVQATKTPNLQTKNQRRPKGLERIGFSAAAKRKAGASPAKPRCNTVKLYFQVPTRSQLRMPFVPSIANPNAPLLAFYRPTRLLAPAPPLPPCPLRTPLLPLPIAQLGSLRPPAAAGLQAGAGAGPGRPRPARPAAAQGRRQGATRRRRRI